MNLDVVYAMDVIEQSFRRMELICGVLVAPPGPPKRVTSLRLLRDVIRGGYMTGASGACAEQLSAAR